MHPVPLANPPNPWDSTSVDYLGEPPPQSMQIFEDHSGSILSKNDSPDLPFTWSVNPYRGCMHACAYCLTGDTPILMGDGRTKALADVRIGDEIYGTQRAVTYRRYIRTSVLRALADREASVPHHAGRRDGARRQRRSSLPHAPRLEVRARG